MALMPSETAEDAAPARGRFDAVVEVNRPLCREHYLLRLRISGPGRFPATEPGQFVQIGCRTPNGAMDVEQLRGGAFDWEPGRRPPLAQPELCGVLPLLRRPFSLAGRGDPADPEGCTWIEIVHRVVGAGTQWLAERRPGDAVDLLGPLGNRFELPHDKSLALLVGGGVGLPPMFYLAEALKGAGWDAVAFVGALTRDLLAVDLNPDADPDPTGLPKNCVEQFGRFGFPAVVTTDDGSLGLKGRITAGLEGVLDALPSDAARRAVVFTCGPLPMMHAVARLAARHRVRCQVCLEQAMACGMGTCQSCVVKIDPTPRPEADWPGDARGPQAFTPEGRPWRYMLACHDGPIFPADVVVW